MSSRPVRFARPLVVAVAGMVLFASAGSARADTVNFSGSRTGTDPVSFTGTLDVTAAGNGTSAVIKVSLNNTTSTGNAVQYGFITGFGLNVPTLNITGATGTSTDPDFKLLTNGTPGVATTLQGGAFDYAFSTNANQLHTVATNEIAKGLGAGQSATFTLTLTGTGLAGLTAAQIIQELSAGSGTSKVPFSVRFRSTNTTLYSGYQGTAPPDGDKVPVSVSTVVKPNPVPAPPGLVLAGMGFGCVMLARLRRKAPQA